MIFLKKKIKAFIFSNIATYILNELVLFGWASIKYQSAFQSDNTFKELSTDDNSDDRQTGLKNPFSILRGS